MPLSRQRSTAARPAPMVTKPARPTRSAPKGTGTLGKCQSAALPKGYGQDKQGHTQPHCTHTVSVAGSTLCTCRSCGNPDPIKTLIVRRHQQRETLACAS